jgi:hypothetical protein
MHPWLAAMHAEFTFSSLFKIIKKNQINNKEKDIISTKS